MKVDFMPDGKHYFEFNYHHQNDKPLTAILSECKEYLDVPDWFRKSKMIPDGKYININGVDQSKNNIVSICIEEDSRIRIISPDHYQCKICHGYGFVGEYQSDGKIKSICCPRCDGLCYVRYK